MTDAKIISISIPEIMDEKLDELVKKGLFSSKSECIRNELRNLFSRYQSDQLSETQKLVTATTALWDIHDENIGSNISRIREKNDNSILGSFHLNVTDAYCLDVLISSGSSVEIFQLIEDIKEIKNLHNVESIVLPSISKHHEHNKTK